MDARHHGRLYSGLFNLSGSARSYETNPLIMPNVPYLDLQHLRYSYGPKPLLEDASLVIEQGERVVLSGPTGSGKTTLLHCILGLLKPVDGQITILGKTCHNENDFSIARRQVGLLFQEPDDQLFCPTVEQDVAFGPLNLGYNEKQSSLIAKGMLERVGLTGYESRLPHSLSGGEKRLAAFAGLLAMEPRMFLLDEPSNGLDEASRERIEGILLDTKATCLIVSHDQRLAEKLGTRKIRLDQGRITDG